MKFPKKMWFMIILEVPKNQAFALSPENKFLEKRQGGEGELKLTPPAFLGLMYFIKMLLGRIELRKLIKPTNKLKHFLKKSAQLIHLHNNARYLQDVCSEDMKYKLHFIYIFLIVNTHLQ